jgi:hypothetical protein
LTALTATEGVISVVETIDTDSDLEGEGNMKIKLKGTSNATITFNSQTGIVKKREDVMSASGTFVMQGFNIPLTMKATNVTTFTSMQP